MKRKDSGIRKLLLVAAVSVVAVLLWPRLGSAPAPGRDDTVAGGSGTATSTVPDPAFQGSEARSSSTRVPTDPNAASGPAPVSAVALPAACRERATGIHVVQGTGPRSPLVGQDVTIQGVVVATFQGGDGGAFGYDLGGFHVQEEDVDADDDPRTSEGVFVHGATGRASVGDLVRVTGRVTEFNDLTELARAKDLVVCARDVALPTPAEIRLPIASLSDLEAFEGMLVTFPQDLVIGDYQDFDRYGEIVLTLPDDDGRRPLQPTAYLAPGSQAASAAAELALRSRIVLDDGRTTQNPHPPRHPNGREFTATNSFRGGDLVRGLTGVLDHSFGSYRVQPTRGATVVTANPRPTAPDGVGGRLRIVGFNVLNYFTTLAGGPDRCGPRRDQDCRGADTGEELRRQRAKIVAALVRLDAHVLGLTELENDPAGNALADLVSALNSATSADRYAAARTSGPVGGDVIRVAILYQPALVRPVAVTAVLDDRSFIDPTRSGEARNRAAVAQTFEEVASGERFTVMVNHLKSKSSTCGRGDDDAVQGSCNGTRTAAVKALLAWLATDPTGAGDPDVLLLGDYNAYAREDPVRALGAGQDGRTGNADDFTDLLGKFVGEGAYTYVYDAQLGYLDYAFASRTLLPQVTGATAWHINADEPDILDYDLSFKPSAQQALFTADPFRSSDHDPVLVGLELGGAANGR